jgi:hypothetical protein
MIRAEEPMDVTQQFDNRLGRLIARLPILRTLGQKPSEVVIRKPGDRFLSAPLPIDPYAAEHWEFAWLSVQAYRKTPAGLKRAARDAQEAQAGHHILQDPEHVLRDAGWTPWSNFPDSTLQKKIDNAHLRVEVWEREEPLAIAVAFGGTVFDNAKDWRANLRWFIPSSHDEYTEVVQTFAPAFAAELQRRASLRGDQIRKAPLFVTGHSLGGGLAQQFAYSLPLDPGVQRVRAVYAFDPSPVTGFYSVPARLRNANKKNLFIDRIYERGEVLALARSLTSLIHKPSARHATIRGVRYSLFEGWNPIMDHSIVRLASQLHVGQRP